MTYLLFIIQCSNGNINDYTFDVFRSAYNGTEYGKRMYVLNVLIKG